MTACDEMEQNDQGPNIDAQSGIVGEDIGSGADTEADTEVEHIEEHS